MRSSVQNAIGLFQSGRLAEARAACDEILTTAPNNALARLLSGEVALAQGQSDLARAHFHALTTQPEAPIEILARAGRFLARLGDLSGAAAALRPAARGGAFSILLELGMIEETLGNTGAALASYAAASRANPGDARPFTRESVLRLRQTYGRPLAAPDKRQDPTLSRAIAMTSLGTNGRFGNQLLQYAFMRCYGRVHRLKVEVPEWVGRWLYDLDDPYPSREWLTMSDEGRLMASLTRESGEVFADTDVAGYFCGDTSYLAPHRDFIRALYRPGGHLRDELDGIAAAVRERGRSVVALHLRRGDFGYGQFWIAPEEWYLERLREIWPTLDRPVLYIASDDPSVVSRFADYDPICAADLPKPRSGLDFITDFHVLTQADCVAISNSTFSFVAAMLNEGARLFWRPMPDGHLAEFDPWNAVVLLPPA